MSWAGFGACGGVRTSSGHGHVVVRVLALVAECLVELVLRLVGSEFCVHVPANFLGTRHGVVELFLWQHVERRKLLLEDLELLLSVTTFLFDEWLHTCWLVRDRDD